MTFDSWSYSGKDLEMAVETLLKSDNKMNKKNCYYFKQQDVDKILDNSKYIFVSFEENYSVYIDKANIDKNKKIIFSEDDTIKIEDFKSKKWGDIIIENLEDSYLLKTSHGN